VLITSSIPAASGTAGFVIVGVFVLAWAAADGRAAGRRIGGCFPVEAWRWHYLSSTRIAW
jgi:hypothetical protein